MMDKIEEVKSYIRQAIKCPLIGVSQVTSMVILHFDIPDKEADLLVLDVMRQLFEPKPDQSRLLTDEEIIESCKKWWRQYTGGELATKSMVNLDLSRVVAAHQRDLTASIVRAECEAECQQKIEALFEEIEGMLDREKNWVQSLKAQYLNKEGE